MSDSQDKAASQDERSTQIEKRMSRTPDMYRDKYEAATSGKSRKCAIRTFCLECVGWNRAEVSRCSDLGCPLWAFRERG